MLLSTWEMHEDDTMIDEDTVRTNLEMPADLARRIRSQAAFDRRTFKPQILVLIEEALDRRETRKTKEKVS